MKSLGTKGESTEVRPLRVVRGSGQRAKLGCAGSRRLKAWTRGAAWLRRLSGTYSRPALVIAQDFWLQRAAGEQARALVFARMSRSWLSAGSSNELGAELFKASAAGLRGAALCGAVAEALSTERWRPGPEAPHAGRQGEPSGEGGTGAEGLQSEELRLRMVLQIGYMSQVVRAQLHSAEHMLSTEPSIRRVLSQLAAEDTRRANLAWSLFEQELRGLDVRALARLKEWLPSAFRCLELAVCDTILACPALGVRAKPELQALGVTDPVVAEQAFRVAVHQHVIPQLQALGLRAASAWARRTREVDSARAGSEDFDFAASSHSEACL